MKINRKSNKVFLTFITQTIKIDEIVQLIILKGKNDYD